MTDHPLLINSWIVNSGTTYDPLWKKPLFDLELQKWKETRKGPLTNTVTNLINWGRVADGHPIYKKARDPSTGPGAPHLEHIFYNSNFAINGMIRPDDTFLSIFTVLASPGSVGSISLQSGDPFAKPLVDPAVYTNAFDATAMAEAVKVADKIVTSKAFDGYVRARFGPEFANATTDEKLLEYVAKKSIILFHGVGTASMSPKDAPWGVTDPDLRVKGVVGVRVADAAAIPYVPSAHPMGPIQALAERAADLIKETAFTESFEFDDHSQFTMNQHVYRPY